MTNSNAPSSSAQVYAEEARNLKRLWDGYPGGRPAQAQFGEIYDIGGQSAVANFLHGRSPLSLKAAMGFARGLGVSIQDFSPRLAAEANAIAQVVEELDSVARMGKGPRTDSPVAHHCPLLGEIRTNGKGELVQELYQNKPSAGNTNIWSHDAEAFALRVRGDALFPRYRSGEFLILSSKAPMVQGSDVLLKLELGPLVVKQWNGERDGEVQLLSLAGEGPPMTVLAEDIAWKERILGSVNRDDVHPKPEK